MIQTRFLQKPRYRLYIDESGDHTYNLLEEASHRYLALLGVWFRQADDYVAFADDLEHFKRGIFGPRPDRPVVLHRSDIINRKGCFGVLCNSEIRERFNAALLEVIIRARFKMVCVIIDKQAHLVRYDSPFHPYHYCLAAMLDRYSGWLNYKNAVGDVMAESRAREEDLQLKQALLLEKGKIVELRKTFGKQVYEAVIRKFNVNTRTGQVEGYGVVWL